MSAEAVVALIAVAAAGYLLGSIPFGYLTARAVKGIDIRRHGSGNIGATNVGRVLGGRWFVVVFLLDLLKGFVPTLLLPLAARAAVSDAGLMDSTALPVAGGLAAIAGHMWPVWLRLRGGKGVATSLGVVVVLDPWATLVAGSVWLLVLAGTRIVSVASMLAAIALAGAHFVISAGKAPFDSANAPLSILILLIPLLVVARHRTNVARLLRGEEHRIGTGAAKRSETAQEPQRPVEGSSAETLARGPGAD